MRKLFLAAALLAAPAHAEAIKVGVNGMVCAFCVKAIETTFRKQESVETVAVDLDAKRIDLVTRAGAKMDDAEVTRLVAEAGYNATTICRPAGAQAC